eukprot:gene3361-13392_t
MGTREFNLLLGQHNGRIPASSHGNPWQQRASRAGMKDIDQVGLFEGDTMAQTKEAVQVKVGDGGSPNVEIGNLSSFSGSTVAKKILDAVQQLPIAIFGKTWCPFCLEVNHTLNTAGVKYTQFNIDTLAEGSQIHAALKEAHGQTTVPYVFIGKFWPRKTLTFPVPYPFHSGGCDAVKALQSEGKLDGKLRAAGLSPLMAARNYKDLALTEGCSRVPGTLFAFPEAADDRVVRFVSLFAFVISVLSAVFFRTSQIHYVMLALAIDFTMRFFGGAAISPLGSLAMCCVSIMEMFGSQPKWVAGPPKQFAALAGISFSALAAFFFLMEVHEQKLIYVGLAFSIALACAAALECFLGFCMACWMFGLGIQFGLVPSNIYAVFTNIKPELQYTWEEMNIRKNEPEPTKHTRHLLDKDHPLSIDYKYKAKTDEWTREDIHMIKHVKITHFLMVMGVAGLACAWKAATLSGSLEAPDAVFQAIALLAAVLQLNWGCLYVAKAIVYPQKVWKEWQCNLHGNSFVVPLINRVLFPYLVWKEWQCNLRGNSFVVPLINLVLFAYLVNDESNTFAKVLFWIGCPLICLISLYRVAMWISGRKDIEHVNAA